MNEPKKNKPSWRILRWILIGAAVLVTLAAVLVTEENWRGKRAWGNYQREAEARGERLDLASVTPAPVPDDQNFFCAPIVAEALNADRNKKAGSNEANRMKFDLYRGDSKLWPTNDTNWRKGTLTDLKEWQRYFKDYNNSPAGKTNGFPLATQPQTPAADILLALSVFTPAIEELRAASQRASARMPLDYENGFDGVGELFPYLAQMKRCCQLFELRIIAELENGQSKLALDDFKLMLRVNDSIRNQPYLISHLVRVAIMSITLQPVFEGVAKHQWSDAELAELQLILAQQDVLADFVNTMNGEKICAIQAMEKQRITREYKTVDDSSGKGKTVIVSMRWTPSAIFYQSELAFAKMHREFISPLVDLTNRITAPEALRQAQVAVQAQGYSPYKVQAQMVFPAIAGAVSKFAQIQAEVDLARVGCALERYQLAKKSYPESLDALAPQFIEKIPHDLINGQPLHYRRTDDGKFVLYSVGWNEKDDGGQIFLTKQGSIDRKKGDWVWKY